jgi:hypothetical protein
MYKQLSSLVLIALFGCGVLALAQRPLEVEKPKAKPKVRPTGPRRPQGSQVAQNRANGVLFVFTEPPAASVIIKARGAVVKQGRSALESGEYRTELPPGLYDVEVSADNHKPFAAKASVRQVGTRPVNADLVPTAGSIIVGLGNVDPDVRITLDGKPVEQSIKRGENQIEIEDIPAGTYKMRISHRTIVDWERPVEVAGGAMTPVNPRFEPAIVNLTIKSVPGAEVFVGDTYQGSTNDAGELKILGKLSPGEHSIRVVKDKYEDGRLRKSFAAGSESVEIKLNRKVFSEPFGDSFLGGAALWDIPRTWQAATGRMVVRGQGRALSIGVIRDKEYADFKAEFDLKFTNGRGAAWIVRAKDKQNYYLFQLVGPKGEGRNRFHSYAVENGQLRQLKPPEFLALDLSGPDDSFHITIEANGSSINHFIEISSSPSAARQPLSVLNDNTFSYGSLGFASKDNEEFAVFFVNITPAK